MRRVEDGERKRGEKGNEERAKVLTLLGKKMDTASTWHSFIQQILAEHLLYGIPYTKY